MKTITIFILSLLIYSTAVAQTASDEQQLKDIIQKQEDQWNKDDFSFFKDESYTPDAILINPIGEVWNGQPEIVKGIGALSDVVLKHTNSRYIVKDIRFLAPTVALVLMYSTEEVEGDFKYPDGKTWAKKGDKSENIFLHTFVKQNDVWRIASTQLTPVLMNAPETKATSKGH